MEDLELDEARVMLGALFMAVRLFQADGDRQYPRDEMIALSLADADALLLASTKT